ncbi:MAG: hypothetical protein ACR2FV_10425 [Ornithinimicrobium sp.]|jgi:hypothetical protein|uniref:hypothetical protein n=1 Tax=Ornithinimicrobium sp. TaxID=1977084 RepID=UPI003D9BE6FA
MEEVYLKDYRTFEEAEQNTGEFIEEVCNKKRLHSSVDLTPVGGQTRVSDVKADEGSPQHAGSNTELPARVS